MEVEKQTMEYWKQRCKLMESAIGYLPDALKKEIIRRASGHAGGKASPKRASESVTTTNVDATSGYVSVDWDSCGFEGILKDEPDVSDVHVDAISKPETTEQFHRLPVNECKITATIDIDKGKGIKALYCGKEKQIGTYLFPVDNFSMAEAKEWVSEHKPKKSEEGAVEKIYEVPICKVDEEKRLVYGIALEPEVVDSQQDFEKETEIEKAAHQFLIKSRITYKEHKEKTPDVKVVESYIAPQDLEFEHSGITHKAKKGSWVLVTHIGDDSIWEQIKKGELTGYSIRGYANRV